MRVQLNIMALKLVKLTERVIRQAHHLVCFFIPVIVQPKHISTSILKTFLAS